MADRRQATHAPELADYAEGVISGKRFRAKAGGWRDDIFSIWQHAVAEAT